MRGHGVRQLLHRVVWPQRARARPVAGAQGPPALHTPTALHKSTSSSPTRGGSAPGRLSSLPRFLLSKQKTKVKSGQCWHSPEPAPPGPKSFTHTTSSSRFSPPFFSLKTRFPFSFLFKLSPKGRAYSQTAEPSSKLRSPAPRSPDKPPRAEPTPKEPAELAGPKLVSNSLAQSRRALETIFKGDWTPSVNGKPASCANNSKEP